MRIFWPRSGLTTQRGDIIGWRIDDTLCVVDIVAIWLDAHSGAGGASDVRVTGLNSIYLLGKAVDINNVASAEGICVVVRRGLPIASSQPCQLILYDPPDPRRLRFLILVPDTLPDTKGKGTAERPDIDVVRTPAQRSMTRMQPYSVGESCGAGVLEAVVPYLNQVIAARRDLGKTPPQRHSMIGDITGVIRFISYAISPSELLLRLIGTTLSACMEVLGYQLGPLTSISNTGDQLNLRITQILEGPRAFGATLDTPGVPLHIRSARYMRFWNTVWLILNDLILGYCARQILLQVKPSISSVTLRAFQQHLSNDVIAILKWLDDWPVGFKLNTPLSAFFCTFFSMLIGSFSDVVLRWLAIRTEGCIEILAFISLFGLTFAISASRDALHLLTAHLYIAHRMSLALSKWQLESLSGLWNLFRGKRWNVLRQRTDSYAYDVDQLFLGTLLFTVSAFLLPTVLTYAALFAALRLVVVCVDKILAWMVGSLNAFPLFELLLRVKEPSRLPAGVTFEIRQQSPTMEAGASSVVPISTYLYMKNSPKSWSAILFNPTTRTPATL